MKAYEETRGTQALNVEQMLKTIADRNADTDTLPAIYARLRAEAVRRPLVIATHDDDSVEKVNLGWGLGARVAAVPGHGGSRAAPARARDARSATVSNTSCTSVGDDAMTRSTSAVAVCCSRRVLISAWAAPSRRRVAALRL